MSFGYYSYQDFLRRLMATYCSVEANGTEQKIRNFANFKAGWRVGEGIQIDVRAIDEACWLHTVLLMNGLVETAAFPGLSGEVQVTAYWNNDYFEFTREANGEWSFIHECLNQIVDEAYSLTPEKLKAILENLPNWICNTSISYHENIGTADYGGLQVSRLNRQVIMEYPSSNRIAFTPHHAQSVLTFEPYIQAQESLQSSGLLTMRSSRIRSTSFQPILTETHAIER
jgi:hypothetical protein